MHMVLKCAAASSTSSSSSSRRGPLGGPRRSRVPLRPSPRRWIMEAAAVRGSAFVLLLFFSVAAAAAAAPSASPVCPRPSFREAALGSAESCSPLDSSASANGIGRTRLIEGDESALQRALNLVYRNKGSYVALLFYASWCPFSKICRTNFQILSSLFPTVGHFAFEESFIRPSVLSRYGVHGFPTLFLLNSTMRVRYHGPRTINSLIGFYNDVTGANPATLDPIYVEKIVSPSNNDDPLEVMEQDNCPFSWARSPEKLLQQDTYLALATCFVLFRLLYFLLPKLSACVLRAWRRQIRHASLASLCDYCYAHIEHVKEVFSRFNPCKRGDLQGAMNAREWASKSLVSVSLGESSGRSYSRSERR